MQQQQNLHKKNEPQAVGLVVRCLHPGQRFQTLENTCISSVCFSQAGKCYVQADLFQFTVLEYDLFGLHQAGGWYD